MHNIILMTDSYKAGHAKCYSRDIETIYSYFESRGGVYPDTVFFGLQYYLKRFLAGIQVTEEKIDEAEKFWNAHFGRPDYFDRTKWEHILLRHGGRLPVQIHAVPEGTSVPVHNVLMTIENTDPACYWLPNFLETLLVKVWYPTTIATQSRWIRSKVLEVLERTGDPTGINFKVHDFGYRGVASEEMAELGAAAHLLSFMGTDTVAGIRMLQEYYGATGMCGFSIPATEHSIMCSFGRDRELEACQNFIEQYPSGLAACVSDTYDIYECCSEIWGGKLRDKVMARKGTLVVRPDSGDYMEVVPKVLEILADKFGCAKNAKGFKVLDPHVRVIQGDGMNPTTIVELYNHLAKLGWSADNLAVGSGGGLLQQVNRDTQKFAFKCSAARVKGDYIDVFKEPVTDTGKKSKKGRLKLVGNRLDGFSTHRIEEWLPDAMDLVFKDGQLLKERTLKDVRQF
jgi:nicotinamide phosphoribosyltransferase